VGDDDRRNTQPTKNVYHAFAGDAVDGVPVLDDRDVSLVELAAARTDLLLP